MLVSLGYSGWAPGQIEQELGQNAWLTVAANTSIIFDMPPDARLGGAMSLLGIDLASLSEEAGHA
jgi:putative transcriptional regulator